MPRLVIVDDHPRLIAGLLGIFSTTSDLQVCGTADSGEAGLVLATTLEPDVVIMDQFMPGMGGISATRAIRDAGSPCRVLMLSSSWTHDQVRAAREAGADGVALKGDPAEGLLYAVRVLANTGHPGSGGPEGLVLEASHRLVPDLSSRTRTTTTPAWLGGHRDARAGPAPRWPAPRTPVD